jgi:hypothetical protein
VALAAGRADGQRALLQALHRGDRVRARTRGGQRAAGLRKQRRAGGGQPNPAGRPLEQGRTELGLQRLDRGGQSRLGDLHAGGRAGEVSLLGDGHEVLQRPQLHSASLRLL